MTGHSFQGSAFKTCRGYGGIASTFYNKRGGGTKWSDPIHCCYFSLSWLLASRVSTLGDTSWSEPADWLLSSHDAGVEGSGWLLLSAWGGSSVGGAESSAWTVSGLVLADSAGVFGGVCVGKELSVSTSLFRDSSALQESSECEKT